MWKFSNLNSGYNLWPPDIGKQNLNPDSSIFQTYANTNGCFSGNSVIPFSGFGVQGSPLRLNSDFISPLNAQVFNPANNSSGVKKASTPTKRLLVFDLSGDKKDLIFGSVANPFQQYLNPILPSSHGSYAFASNSHGSDEEQEEMHEDTEEIDALLYSDSEFSFDSEEASTGHSPLNMKDEEEVTISPTPAKRRKLDLNYSAIDESLMDTASSAKKSSNFPETPLDGNADISYVVDSGSNLYDESREEEIEKIQTIVKALRRIIPGGDAMDTASVLDEAIRYLKFLKLQANSMDATTASII